MYEEIQQLRNEIESLRSEVDLLKYELKTDNPHYCGTINTDYSVGSWVARIKEELEIDNINRNSVINTNNGSSNVATVGILIRKLIEIVGLNLSDTSIYNRYCNNDNDELSNNTIKERLRILEKELKIDEEKMNDSYDNYDLYSNRELVESEINNEDNYSSEEKKKTIAYNVYKLMSVFKDIMSNERLIEFKEFLEDREKILEEARQGFETFRYRVTQEIRNGITAEKVVEEFCKFRNKTEQEFSEFRIKKENEVKELKEKVEALCKPLQQKAHVIDEISKLLEELQYEKKFVDTKYF